jgi:predicted transcriptional regulator of viral defense system
MAITYLKKSALALQALEERHGSILRLPADAQLLADTGIHDLRPLVRQGLLEDLAPRGLYRIRHVPRLLPLNHLALIPALTDPRPYYISWWSALSFHDLTEQLPRTVSVAVTSKRRHAELAGLLIRFVRVAPQKFFGFRTVRLDGMPVAIATPEKAIIDSLDLPAYAGGLGEIAKAIASPRISSNQLVRLAQRYGVHAVAQRLGWLIENIRGEDASRLLPMANPGSPYRLNAAAERAGEIDVRWNLVLNASPTSLTAWRRS